MLKKERKADIIFETGLYSECIVSSIYVDIQEFFFLLASWKTLFGHLDYRTQRQVRLTISMVYFLLVLVVWL